MYKNYMGEIAKMIGFELDEEFVIQNEEKYVNVMLCADGLRVAHTQKDRSYKLLTQLLIGDFEAVKKPFIPQYGEVYWSIEINAREKAYIDWSTWNNDVFDYMRLKMGLIYRTENEAIAHLAEDYKKVTGKELEENEK